MSQRLKGQGKDNYYVNKTLRILKALFLWAVNDLDVLDKSPVRIKMFPINKRLKYIPPARDIERVLEKCNPDQQNLVKFVMNTGARIIEVLRATDQDYKNGKIVLWTRKNKFVNDRPGRLTIRPTLKFSKAVSSPSGKTTPAS